MVQEAHRVVLDKGVLLASLDQLGEAGQEGLEARLGEAQGGLAGEEGHTGSGAEGHGKHNLGRWARDGGWPGEYHCCTMDIIVGVSPRTPCRPLVSGSMDHQAAEVAVAKLLLKLQASTCVVGQASTCVVDKSALDILAKVLSLSMSLWWWPSARACRHRADYAPVGRQRPYCRAPAHQCL